MGNYYEDSEQIGNELFTKWAEEVNVFSDMERQPLLSKVDWICKSNKGNLVNCELKVRNTLSYQTIFIEPGKYNNLVRLWNEKRIIPWYINLCGDEVLVFDLRYVRPCRITNVRIWSHPDQNYKYVDRFELETNKALKFINGKQIKK